VRAHVGYELGEGGGVGEERGELVASHTAVGAVDR
jgi:hypothetical protein